MKPDQRVPQDHRGQKAQKDQPVSLDQRVPQVLQDHKAHRE